jgi:hypothetical protein
VMTRTPADPSPSGGADKIEEAVTSRVLEILESTPVSTNITFTEPRHNGIHGSSCLAAMDYQKIGAELTKLTLAYVRRKRREVQQASAVSLVGAILLWAGLIIGIVCEAGLITLLGWDITHPLSHPDMAPLLASTVANGAGSGTAAFLFRRFGIGKSNRTAMSKKVSEAVNETLSGL